MINENILVYAARYAHKRNTGAALQVVKAIISEWENLTEQTKEQLIKEAKSEPVFNHHGWSRLLAYAENEKG